MENTFITNRRASATFYKVIITCPTLPFLMKNNILSAYGDSGTYGISNNTAKCYTSIC